MLDRWATRYAGNMSSGPKDTGPSPPALTADEAAFRASFAQLVDWYRVSQAPMLRRAFMPAMLGFVPLGGLSITLGTSRLLPASLGPIAILAGIAIVAAGPIWCAFTLLSSIGNDRYLAIRVDGLALKLVADAPERLIVWEELEDARYDETTHCAHLTIRDRSSCTLSEPFADVSLPELMRRVRDARRLSVWQRLTPETNLR